jgi:hypothetical protein
MVYYSNSLLYHRRSNMFFFNAYGTLPILELNWMHNEAKLLPVISQI